MAAAWLRREYDAGWRGVQVDIDGAAALSDALGDIARKQPKLFRSALSMEVKNLKKSIAATLRNYKITKYKYDPDGKGGKGAWQSKKLAPRSAITKVLNGAKNKSQLQNPGPIKITGSGDKITVGHFGTLGQYAIRFQDGVPRSLSDVAFRHAAYQRLGSLYDVHNYAQLVGLFLPISPKREYIEDLATKCQRDFVPGMLGSLDRLVSSEIKRATKKKRNQSGRYRKRLSATYTK